MVRIRKKAKGHSNSRDFVLGVDLDGVCADFYGRMREIVAEWKGVDVCSLNEEVSYGLRGWGVADDEEYEKIHRFAVTQRDLFRTMDPIPGAAQGVRRLEAAGVDIRIITHRLFIPHFHQVAVAQTVEWLDWHGFPYWDLCFMKDKPLVGADVYVEDSEKNIRELEKFEDRAVITFTNSTNAKMDPPPRLRAHTWSEVELMVLAEMTKWRKKR